LKKNKKYGLTAIASIAIGFLVLISFQPGTDLFSSLPESELTPIKSDDKLPVSTFDRTYGTIKASFGSSVMGSPDAPITIIVFGDYQCPGCKSWFKNTFPEIEEKLIDTEKANLVFIDTMLIGRDSLKAAEAAYCANEQEKYWEYHSFLFANQLEVDNGWASVDSLKGYAFNLELDMDSFERCIDSGKYEKKVKFNASETEKNGITEIPSFVIIDLEGRHHLIKGGASYPVFEQVIELFLQKLVND